MGFLLPGADILVDYTLMLLGKLSTLGPAAVQHVTSHARERALGANDIVYHQDDQSTHFFVVQSGYVRLSYITEEGFVSLFAIMAPGGTFGEAGVLGGFDHVETASTIGPTRVMAISADCMKGEGPGPDELRAAVARLVARRYLSQMQLTRALYLPKLSQRLAHALLQLLGSLGNTLRYKGAMVECLGPVVTQSDLGSMARGTRENINKTLRRWEKDGLIGLEDRHILILDKPRLENVALAIDD